MSWKLFWAYGTSVAELGGTGFSIFSLPHLIWLAVCLAGVVGYSVAYRRGGESRRDNLRKGLALFMILFEITKQCAVALTGAPSEKFLPLHICSIAIYTALIDALWPQNRFFKQLMAFAFLPAALIALLLPTVTQYPPLSFYPIHQFLMHGGIAAYIVARYSAGEVRPCYAGVWLTLLATAVFTGLIYPLNLAFQTNYIFLTYHENNPALKLVWNLSGGTGGLAYILGLAVLVTLVFHIVYAVYAVLKKTRSSANAASC